MFDLGDDFIVGSDRVPWLIWIQLIVMLLLILLFCHLGALSFDLDLSSNSSKPGPSFSPLLLGSFADQYSSPAANTKAVENKSIPVIECEVRTGTSGIIAAIGGRENDEEKELGGGASNFSYHPCHYFGLARRAFLKCLGLDSKSTAHSNKEHSKEE
ncbi:uncharacterized protein LOC124926925 [Impatiens glandulifera]|uniref:uncharacterized protein LOC124926925 n=1 Tax=Impatiens glandulifera TaxID=253017 RepID=UPI001FB0E9CF|nr:uncharacterized protein LOC124926925 [Impatiens glandulifera]